MMSAESVTTHPQILIVEDDELTAKLIERRLQLLGYRIAACARSGIEALEKAAETHPDLVLMDISLEGEMDGVEAARRMHEYFDVPVAYLTGCLDEETVDRAADTAPFGYIEKPFEAREVHRTIQLALVRHRLETELDASRRWMSTIMRAIGEGLIATMPDGLIRFMNPVAETLTGWKQPEALGQPLAHVFHVEGAPTRAGAVSTEIRDAKRALLVGRHGRQIPIEYRTALAWDEQGNIAGLVWTFQDITERQRVDDALRHAEQHFRSLIETALDVILVIDRESTIDYASPSLKGVLGYQPEDVLGKSAAELMHADDQKRLLAFAVLVRAGQQPGAMTMRARHGSGTWRVVEVTGSRLPDRAGGVAITVRDITERSRDDAPA